MSEPYTIESLPEPLGGMFDVMFDAEQAERDERACEGTKRLTRPSIDERFADFLRDHADVVNAVVVVSRQMKKAGYERYSVKAAWEVVRWQSRTSAHVAAALYQGGEPALNNSMTAPLARHIMAICPDLEGFYETRKRKGEL